MTTELGPTDWAGYIGQERLKANLKVRIASSLSRTSRLDHILLMGPPGVGKGHPLDTPVLTPTGWTEVGALVPGDEVISADGRPTKVLDVYDRGVLPVYRVTFSDGAEVKVDGDHLWKVQTSKQRRRDNWQVRPTRDLVGDLLTPDNRAKWYVPLVKPVEHEDVELPIEPYLLGVLLANGYLKAPTIYTNDQEIVDCIEAANPGLLVEGEPTNTSRRWGVPGFRDRLRLLGLFGELSGNKFIPEVYLTASLSARQALLAGLLDCDGSVRSDRDQALYHTTSPALAAGVRALAESLGGTASIYSITDAQVRDGYEYRVGLNLSENPFRLERKANKFRPSQRVFRSIAAVEEDAAEKIRCIRVAAADSLYVVSRRYVVTHNTTLVDLIAAESQDDLLVLSKPVNNKALLDHLFDLRAGILFIDECHAWARAGQETLMQLLDGFVESRAGRIEFDWITVIAATTERAGIIQPLHDRFPVRPEWDPYTNQDMALIVQSMAKRADLKLDNETALALSIACASTPRNARTLVLAARDMALSTGTVPSAEAILDFCQISPDGLSLSHLSYLTYLRDLGGQAGLEMMCTRLAQNRSAVTNIERVLFDRRLVGLEPGGRVLTAGGRRRLEQRAA